MNMTQAMKTHGVQCLESKGSAEAAVNKILEARK